MDHIYWFEDNEYIRNIEGQETIKEKIVGKEITSIEEGDANNVIINLSDGTRVSLQPDIGFNWSVYTWKGKSYTEKES